MTNVRVYIDGFNLYHAIEKTGRIELKWLNLSALGKDLLRPNETLDEVHFFTDDEMHRYGREIAALARNA